MLMNCALYSRIDESPARHRHRELAKSCEIEDKSNRRNAFSSLKVLRQETCSGLLGLGSATCRGSWDAASKQKEGANGDETLDFRLDNDSVISMRFSPRVRHRVHHPKPQVLYEDGKCIILNKPVAVAIQAKHTPAGAIWDAILQDLRIRTKCPQLTPVHRLDSNSSGALMLAKTQQSARALSKSWASDMKKVYLAIVQSPRPLSPTSGALSCNIHVTRTGVEINDQLGKHAHADWHLLDQRNGFSLLKLHLHSGRKHQLRVQLSSLLDAPIVGDFKYGYQGDKVDGHFLHAASLAFSVYTQSGGKKFSKRDVTVHAPPPQAFVAFCRAHGLKLDFKQDADSVTQLISDHHSQE